MTYRFGTFEFDTSNGELSRNGRGVAIEPQPAKALALLLARAGDVVTREEMRDGVWGDTHVDVERGLAYCISQVRAALGDSGDNPRFVQTIPRRGFKFIAPISNGSPASVPAAPAAEVKAPAVARMPMTIAGLALIAFVGFLLWELRPGVSEHVVIAVSIFDNETGNADYDRVVAGLSDLVVERLTKLAPDRLDIIGNAAVLRQPRNIRNLKALADDLPANYVLLGQLQRGEGGLRFITHFIRLQDEAHLKANRLDINDPTLNGLEAAVVGEFESAVRNHILNHAGN